MESRWSGKAKEVGLQASVDGGVVRTKSLTEQDLEEIKACVDLGFGFRYDDIPQLCKTLPALDLCYSMRQSMSSSEASSGGGGGGAAVSSPPIADWNIYTPGDHPDEVKARLMFWAQTVAYTVRLCR